MCRAIGQAVAEHLRSSSAELDVRGPVARTKTSEIYFATGTAAPFPLAIKQFLQDRGADVARSEAREAYDSMCRLHALTEGDMVLASPRPIGLLPERAIIVSEWIEGVTLAKALNREPRTRELELVSSAGAWLGRLAAVASSEMAPMRPEEFVRGLEWPCMSPPHVTALAFLRKTAQEAARDAVPWLQTLGDFKPENLMLSGNRLYGIDSQMLYVGPQVLDAAHFLNHVAVQRWLRLMGPRGMAWTTALDDAFRHGYRTREGLELPAVPLLWSRLRGALHMAASVRARSRSYISLATARLLERLVKLQHARLRRALAVA